MKWHELKSWPEHFQDIANGKRTFELRRDDRGYQVGDVLELLEWEPGDHPDRATARYTGRSARRRITYVLRGAGLGCVAPLKGLSVGYCILGLENIDSELLSRP
jgi:hypothetical protein